MKLLISPKRIAKILVLVVLFLTFASVAARIVRVGWGYGGPLEVASLFDTGQEQTISTWYSSFTLLFCSVLLAVIAAARKQEGGRYILHWSGLSIIFLFMSIDEVATIHETVGNSLGRLLSGIMGITNSGLLHFAWVIPAALLVLGVVLIYLRFLADLPKKTLLLFLLAAALFVGGSILIEMLEGQQMSFLSSESGAKWRDLPLDAKVWSSVRQTIEEMLEMLGIVVFIYALLSYMSSWTNEVTVRIGAKDE